MKNQYLINKLTKILVRTDLVIEIYLMFFLSCVLIKVIKFYYYYYLFSGFYNKIDDFVGKFVSRVSFHLWCEMFEDEAGDYISVVCHLGHLEKNTNVN